MNKELKRARAGYSGPPRNERITAARVAQLALTDFFQRPEPAACIAILPFVQPAYTGVEIGVFQGFSSRLFLEHCQFMYFVDPCIEYSANPDRCYFPEAKEFLAALAAYEPDRFSFIQHFSADAAPLILAVDFVFVDGNHAYEFVKQDLQLYWPKVRSGGFISGHDYNPDIPDVPRAVNEFFGDLGLPVEKHQYCWRVPKP